jgi:hypothetical protein
MEMQIESITARYLDLTARLEQLRNEAQGGDERYFDNHPEAFDSLTRGVVDGRINSDEAAHTYSIIAMITLRRAEQYLESFRSSRELISALTKQLIESENPLQAQLRVELQ